MVTLQDIIEEMRTIAMVAGQFSVEGPRGTLSDMAAAEAERAGRWADALTALTLAGVVDTDDTCPSTHTLRCTLARGHDGGPHTAFRTRVSWTDDVDATARLRERARHWLESSPDVPYDAARESELDAQHHNEAYDLIEEFLALLSPLRSTPQEGTTDLTRIGELGVQLPPQHAAKNGGQS